MSRAATASTAGCSLRVSAANRLLSESSCSLAAGIAQAPEMRGPIWAYVPVDLTRKLTEEFWGSANGSFVKLGVLFWGSP